MPANSPEGVLAKLSLALTHMGGLVTTDRARARHDIIRRCDFDEVSTIEREMDFEQEVAFGAIRDLTNQLKFRQEF